MATVRFSGELRDTILHRAGRLFDTRQKAAQGAFNPQWGQGIYDGVFAATKDDMISMPDGYFSMISQISLAGFSGLQNNHRIPNLMLPTARPVPSQISSAETHGLADGRTYGGYTLDSRDPRWKTLLAEYILYIDAITAIEAERDTFVEGVKKVINTFSTLAPALKAWPPLWDLVPAHVQDKHKEIVEKRTAKAVDSTDTDLSKMTATMVVSKMIGGKA